jgi:hypothetical protein
MSPLLVRLLIMAGLGLALAWLTRHYKLGDLNYALYWIAVVIAALVAMTPRTIVLLFEWLSEVNHTARWQSRQGRHYEFAGISLDIRDDGTHAWLRADGLKGLLGAREADDIFAARVASGRWQRDRQGLWLRVDAVVQHLAEAPDRNAPRRRRLRQHLEREVLVPLERRRRNAPGGAESAPEPPPEAQDGPPGPDPADTPPGAR